MTKHFQLGDDARCDLDALVDTRLLVQANSGGGKSWCLRRLLEQTHGKVQHLVIDPEGEFSSGLCTSRRTGSAAPEKRIP